MAEKSPPFPSWAKKFGVRSPQSAPPVEGGGRDSHDSPYPSCEKILGRPNLPRSCHHHYTACMVSTRLIRGKYYTHTIDRIRVITASPTRRRSCGLPMYLLHT
jgi:hypothetical protein